MRKDTSMMLHKGEEPGEKMNLMDYEYSSSEDDDYVRTDGTRRRTREEWIRYYKQIEESEGFDVDPIPGTCEHGLTGLENFDSVTLVESTKAAIEHFNIENNTSYKFVKIERATCCVAAGFEYRITFQAVDGEAEPKTFQAITFYWIDCSITVDFCRLKSSASS
ncbi:uncharacterized protein LOC109705072 [Ananas comosus]|uniref:Uncharacterized protein LOC109705072 n=1 Tax=Ananas comosus TaxID=4615 RepID=A0A6P5EDU6_ANACO|nr:uncharacterized protein LOC109705072 [Ananas comosus]